MGVILKDKQRESGQTFLDSFFFKIVLIYLREVERALAGEGQRKNQTPH